MSKTKVQLPLIDIRAAIASADKEARTIEIVFSTGKRGLRRGWSGRYYEELEVSDRAIRMERINNGAAPFLKNHGSWAGATIEDQIGVVERAWVEGANAKAIVRLSKRDDVEPIFQDMVDGILRNISVGYLVHKYEEVATGDDELPVFRAVDWEPMEISLVAIPFDEKSQTRNNETTLNDCEIISRVEEKQEIPMPPVETKETAPVIDAEKIKREAVEAEKARSEGIVESVRKAGLGAEFAEKLIKESKSVEEARAAIIDEMAERQKTETNNKVAVTVERDEKQARREGVLEAILHRGSAMGFGKQSELTDKGRKYRGMSLLAMMAECSGLDARYASRDEIIKRGFHSTSDFPNLLLDAVNKTLQSEYQELPQTFAPFVRRVSIADFKNKHTVKLGDYPVMKELAETGEVEYGTISEGKESYKLKTYARGVKVSRELIINDDLDGLLRVPAMAGRRVRELEGDLVWALITSNPVMADSQSLFSAAHANIEAAAAIAVASVGAGVAKMRKQKGLDGARIDVRPQFFLVPVALETLAKQFMTQIVPNDNAKVNPWAGTMQVIADPRLDDSSTSKWYLAASPSQIDTIELATLDGMGPQFSTEEGFDVLGMKMKMVYDVGVGLIDHRGFFGNGTFA